MKSIHFIQAIIIGFILLFQQSIFAQISINEDGSNPDASAMLDVKSTDKGMLVPRMTTSERTSISSPAKGLLVFDNTTNSFWFYTTEWNEIVNNSELLTTDNFLEQEGTYDFSCLSNIGTVGLGTFPFDIAVSGNYAYVVDVTDGDFKIIDVSNPESPTLVGTLVYGSPTDVAVSGNYAFLLESSTTNSFHVIDISDPTNPVWNNSTTINRPYGIKIWGNYAYIVETGDDELEIFDISNPLSPNKVGSVSISDYSSPVMDISEDYLYIMDNRYGNSNNSSFLDIVNISDVTNPTLESTTSLAGQSTSVAVSGNYAFVTNQTSNDVKLYDISDPTNPTYYTNATVGPSPYGIKIVGSYAYFNDTDADMLRIFNISDVSNISLEAEITVGGFPRGLIIENGFAYIIDAVSQDLKIIDITCDAILGFNPLSGEIVEYPNPNTDDQTIDEFSLSGNNLQLSLEDDGESTLTVDLSTFLDNTDGQELSLNTNILSISNGTNTIDLSSYLDNTDGQELSLSTDILSISNGTNTVDLSSYLDNTDDQTIDEFSLSGNNLQLSLEDDGESTLTVDLSTFLDNTDGQELSLNTNILSISNGTNTIDLSSYLDNTDGQELSLNTNILSISNGTNTIDLSSYLDNTDDQTIDEFSLSGNDLQLSLENDGESTLTVDLSTFLDNTDGQELSLNTNILSISNGTNTIDLSNYLDNTDNQTIDTLRLDGNHLELSLTNDSEAAQRLDLSSFLDNTDNQTVDKFELDGTVLKLSLADDGQSPKMVDLTSLVPIGTIQMWPTSTPPTGWLLCDGTTFNATTYPDLNTLLGGNTLPDFVGRFPLGVGNSLEPGGVNHALGDTGGEETHTLTISEMPAHSHNINYSSKSKSGSGGEVSDLEADANDISTDSEGGGQAHNNMPPYYTINFIIKAQ